MYLRTSKPYRKRPQNTRPMGLQKSPSRKFKNYQTTPILLKLNQQLSNLKNLKTKDLIITKVTSKVPRRSCIKTRPQFLNLVFNLLFPQTPSYCLHHVLSNPVSKPAYQLQEKRTPYANCKKPISVHRIAIPFSYESERNLKHQYQNSYSI